MQATSTPTLAQPKSSAFAALGGAAVLAAAIGVGALIGANLSTIAAPTAGDDANVAAYALGVQRNGEIGALTPAQRGLALQRKGEISLGATTPVAPVEIMPKGELFTTPTGTTIFRIGGRDPQASFNQNSGYVSDHDLQANAAAQGTRLMNGLRAIAERTPAVGDVRGKGLMIGVELVEPGGNTPSVAIAAAVLEESRARGLLVGKGGLHNNVIRLAPPMTVTEDEVDEALEALTGAIDAATGTGGE